MAKKPKTLSLLKTPRAVELEYYKQLKQLANEMKKDINETILPILENVSLDSKYTKDVGVTDLLSALNILQGKYSNTFAFATRVANSVVSRLLNMGNDKFRKTLEGAYGVDVGRMINQNKLNDLVALQRRKQEVLIKSIPAQFFNQIEMIIQNGVSGNKTYKSIANEIKGISGISSTFGKLDNRVKLIARQEVSVINESLNVARAKSADISLYTFQTSGDERVRESHQVMDGKVCKIDDDTVYADSVEDANAGNWKNRSSIGGIELAPRFDYSCRCNSIFIIPEN